MVSAENTKDDIIRVPRRVIEDMIARLQEIQQGLDRLKKDLRKP